MRKINPLNPIDLFRVIPLDILKKKKSYTAKSNLMPGSLMYTGEIKMDKVVMTAMAYNGDDFTEVSINTAEELKNIDYNGKILWLNVAGLHDIELIRAIGEQFNIHNLSLEDVLNLSQRPKWEEFDDYFFQVCKMVRQENDKIAHEQFSMVVGKDFMITFQEDAKDNFDGVRERLKTYKGKIRLRGADYLAFALLDVIVDHYLIITELYADRVDDLEEELNDNPKQAFIDRLSTMKKELNWLRRTTRPLKESVINFSKSQTPLIERKTAPFLKDLLDHVTHLTENVELYMDELKDLMDHYNNKMNNKLNDILKVLTIFSVVFIPLTFMAGIYGMNFENFPELSYQYAYPVFWGAIITVASGMIYYFKRRGWL
jgi:magnesium transporter